MSANIWEQKKTIIDAVLDLKKKLNAIEYILEKVKEPKGKIALEIFDELLNSIFFLLLESIVVNLSWLYEKTWRFDKHGKKIKDKKIRSLFWYLEEQIKSNPQKADEFNLLITKADSLDALVKKLRSVRDKWVVHRDEKAVENPEKFLEEVGLKLEDVKKLINSADEIIQEHFPISDSNSFGIHRLFWVVEYADMLPSKIEEIERELK